MNVPESMKLNKFRDVKIPKGRDIWKRISASNLKEPSKNLYTGDETIPDGNKIEMAEYANKRIQHHKMNTEDLPED